MKPRIGLFGGSFDPLHGGHLICARIAAEQLGLSKVLLIPAANQPHKPNGPIAPAAARYMMCQAASALDPLFEPSRLEIDRGGVSFTVDTVAALRQFYPEAGFELFCLIGADNLRELETWKEPDRLLSLSRLGVMKRAGVCLTLPRPEWSDRIILVDTPVIEISSTWIRERRFKGLSISALVIPEVLNIIEREGLYLEVVKTKLSNC